MRRLYYSQNSNPRLALSVARFLGFGERPGLEMEFEAASPFEPAHTPFFKALNPNIQIPILVEDGEPLWEADAIACRLIRVAQSPLWPLDEGLPDGAHAPRHPAPLRPGPAAGHRARALGRQRDVDVLAGLHGRRGSLGRARRRRGPRSAPTIVGTSVAASTTGFLGIM